MFLNIGNLENQSNLVWDPISKITSELVTNDLLLYVITNEKTVKLIQLDRLLSASETSPSETRSNNSGWYTQGRLTVNYRYTHRKFQLKFSALLKDYDLKYAENSKKNLT